ncbi:MAG TPA: hypothetical protein DCX21_07110 [Eubacterium sp.]|nr:hypothetical protein [Eubacterium sp.]HBZ53088.1 hypothetical protein [Eubacterium sp.]
MEKYEKFTLLIGKIEKDIKRIKCDQMREYGLRGIHVNCLYYLYNGIANTVIVLVNLLGEDKGNVSRGIEYLEVQGLIKPRNQDTRRRHNERIELTKRGEEIAKVVCKKIDEFVEEVSVGLSADELKSMYSALNIISDNLDKIGAKKNND